MGFLSDLIGGKQKVVPTSSSEAFSESSAGSVSQGASSSVGSSLSRSTSSVFNADIYKSLFGGASNAASRAAELVPGIQGAASSLFTSGGRFLEELEGELETAGRLGESGFEDEQIAHLGSDLGRFYEEEINPRLTSRGVAAGQFGGSRGEVAQGVASRGLAEEFSKGSTAIRLAGQDRRDRLAGQVDSLRADRSSRGIDALPGLLGLAESGIGAELAPYLQLSQIIGGPTVLTDSESGSFSESGSSQLARSFSESRGSSTSKGSTVTKGPGLLDVLNTVAQFK
jgi:hypothetical protein